MMYDGRDLYKEWEKKSDAGNEEPYSEYAKRVSLEITVKILGKYDFLLNMGYYSIKNIDNHIVRFERKQGNCLFGIYYPGMSSVHLSVYYTNIPLELVFNGDGEYDECINVNERPVSINKESVELAEQKLISIFNEELNKLKIERS